MFYVLRSWAESGKDLENFMMRKSLRSFELNHKLQHKPCIFEGSNRFSSQLEAIC